MEKCHNCGETMQDKGRRCPQCGHMNCRVTPQPYMSANMDRVIGFVLGAILMCLALSGLILVPVLLVFLHEKRPQFCSGLVAGLVVVNAVLLGIVLNFVWGVYSLRGDASDACMPIVWKANNARFQFMHRMPAEATLNARARDGRTGGSTGTIGCRCACWHGAVPDVRNWISDSACADGHFSGALSSILHRNDHWPVGNLSGISCAVMALPAY